MSLEEMENTWNAQPAPDPDATDASNWIERSRRTFRRHVLLLLVGVLGNAAGLGLQIHRLVTVPGRTVSNSSWELLIPTVAFVICLVGAVLLRRSLHRYRSLRHDTRHCLQLILKEKRSEILALTRWLPVAYLGFLALIILSKFQSIAAEFETPSNAWSGVWMAAGLFIVISAFLFHRANAFLKPEVADIERTLKSLLAD